MSPSATADPEAERWAEPVYLDASALVKLFVPETESDELNQALSSLSHVIVSDLALTEMASGLAAARANNSSRARKRIACTVKRRSCTRPHSMPR